MKITDKLLNDFNTYQNKEQNINKEICKIKQKKFQTLFNNYSQEQLNQFTKLEHFKREFEMNLTICFTFAGMFLIVSNIGLLGVPRKDWNTLNLPFLFTLEALGMILLGFGIHLLVKNRKIKKILKNIK